MSAFDGFMEGLQGARAFRQVRGENALASALQSGDMRGARNAFATAAPVQAYQSMQPDPAAQREAAAGLVRGVLGVDPQSRPQAWQAARRQAQSFGMDISGIPDEYPGDEYVTLLNGMLSEKPEAATELERLRAMLPPEEFNRAVRIKYGLEPDANTTTRQDEDPIAALRLRAQEAGLRPGTPAYQDFMQNGGVERTQDITATFRPATPEEARRYGATAGQVDTRTNRFYASDTREAPAEGERKAAGFFERMEAAEAIIGELEAKGITSVGRVELGLNMVLPEDLALSGDSLKLRQAQRDWVRSKLRFESGAVIGDEEADEEIKTYFPMPNTPPAVRQQMAAARRTAMEAMRSAAGRAMSQSGGGSPPTQPPAPTFNVPDPIRQQAQPGDIIEGPNGERLFFNGSDFVPIDG